MYTAWPTIAAPKPVTASGIGGYSWAETAVSDANTRLAKLKSLP